MAIRTNPRTLVDNDADPAITNKIASVASTTNQQKSAYLDDLQDIPPLTDNTEIFISECNPTNRITQLLNNLTLCVGTANTSNTYCNVYENPTKLAFNSDNGFTVDYVGTGLVKVSIDNSFRCWNVNGSPGLVACNTSTINLVAGCNVSLTPNNSSNPKTLTIGATTGGENTQLQYNDNNLFAGSPSLTWNKSNNRLNVSGTVESGPIHENFSANNPAELEITLGAGYSIDIISGGTGFTYGQEIFIPGTLLGGTSPTNDATLTVTAVGSNGEMANANLSSGIKVPGTYNFNVFSINTPTNIFYMSTGIDSLNVSDVNLLNNFCTNFVMIINQTADAKVPTSFSIDGTVVPLKYPNGLVIEGTPNSIDVVNISVFKTGSSSYLALAQVMSFE